MEKSALKELVERLVGKGISESQTDLFPKLRGGQHDRGNDTIVYRETKKALRRVVNTLPDNITSEADIKPVCDFLDTVRFGRINDAQFSNSLRRLIAEGRKKFAIALQSQTRKSVMPGHAGEGLAAQTGSSPTKPEDQKTIEMSGALYEQFVYQAIAGCFELYEQFLKNLFANSAASDAPLKREDVKTRIDDVKAALTEASFRIKDSIITQNPAERILGSKEKKVVIPKEEIGAIISETVLIMGNIMPIEINREAAEPLIAAFLTAHVPAHITVPRAISEKERDDLQNPELRDYLIDDVAHNSLRQALVQTRKNLLPEEKEVFIALVLDHISEKLPKVVPQERAINDYFHSNEGREFLIDLAVEFNDKYHGSIELRDDESLLGSIALEMPTIVVNLIARDKESNPPDDDLTHVSEPSSFPVNPKLPDDLKVRITEFSTWAKQYDKPGALLLLKLIVAAGQTLDTYGQTLSPAQAEIVLNLFEGLQEILVEREEGSKKRAVRVDSLVTLILDALKPVTPKPETKGRKALEGLDDKVSELERRIDEFVMETNELGSLRRHAAGLEVEDGELQPALKQAEEELETARKDLAETTIRLRAGSVGDGDFARTLGELNEKNVVFETKKVAHEGVKAKRDAIGNRWAEANLAIDKLSEKIRLLEELRQQYDRLITLIDHL